MVSICDSWQTKAEKAAERRTISKQKKQQRDRNRLNKSLAQKLLAFLQERNHSILLSASTGSNKNTDLNIHLWTDSTPNGHPFCGTVAPPSDDDYDEPSVVATCQHSNSLAANRNIRSRSNSCVDKPPLESPKRNKKGRNRSNSDAGAYPSPGRRKNRSGSYGSEPQGTRWNDGDASSIMPVPMCLDHFFGCCTSAHISESITGNRRVFDNSYVPRCSNGLHPTHKKGNPTLASILLCEKEDSTVTKSTGANLQRFKLNQQALAASASTAKSFAKGVTGATGSAPATSRLDMLYHLDAKLNMSDFQYDSAEHSSLIVDSVASLLTLHECSMSSIVYVTINDILIFDRFQNGIVLTNTDEEFLLFGGSKRRTVSLGEFNDESLQRSNHSQGAKDDSIEEHHQRLVQYLPGHVLEYILAFLPQSAVAAFPRVCKAWHNEIWYSSQGLWSNLLERNRWPHPHDNCLSKDRALLYRKSFVNHYKAVRDVKAIMHGLESLMLENSTPNSSKDVATLDFKDIMGRPVSGDTFVRNWSCSRVLVGSGDNTLHLYEIVDSSTGTGKRCKLSLRVNAAPFSNTKKRTCKMVGLDLDDRFVGCLYRGGSEEGPETWFSVIERDELLGAGKGGSHVSDLDEVLESYDIKSLLLDYIRQGDDKIFPSWMSSLIVDFQQVDFECLEVLISENFVACGNGEFLFEANILYLPHEDEEFPNILFAEPFGFSKLFLFSSDCGNISWVSPATLQGHVGAFTLSKVPHGTRNHSHAEESIETSRDEAVRVHAVILLDTGDMAKLTVHGSGDVKHVKIPVPSPTFSSPSLVGLSEEVMILLHQNGRTMRLLSLNDDGPSSDFTETELVSDSDYSAVMPLREEYLIAIGTQINNSALTPRRADTDTIVRLFHVPSREMIHTATFKQKDLPRFSFCTAQDDSYIAICADHYGVLVAGHGVSLISNENWDRKTKRKKGTRTKGKRDYFARGLRRTMA